MSEVLGGVALWARRLLQTAALCLLATLLWFVAGLEGVLVSGVVVGIWFVAPTVYAFAVGQLLYGAFLVPVSEAYLVGAAAFGTLFVADFALEWSSSTAVTATVAFTLVWIGLGSVWLIESLWSAVGLVVVAFALLAYGVHRIELVTLGLLPEVAT